MNIRRTIRRVKERLIKTVESKYESLFPDQTTTRLMQILGASTLVVGGFRNNGRPMTVVLWRGALLRHEHFKLSFLDGKPVLMNDIKRAIMLEDDDYVRDILVEQARDEWLKENQYATQFISPNLLNNNPARVKQIVQQFIYS